MTREIESVHTFTREQKYRLDKETVRCSVCKLDVSTEELHNFGQTDYLCDECEEVLI